jgi:hypothetical protein
MYFQYEDDFEKLYLETEKGKNVKQALHDLSCKVFGVNAQEIEI